MNLRCKKPNLVKMKFWKSFKSSNNNNGNGGGGGGKSKRSSARRRSRNNNEIPNNNDEENIYEDFRHSGVSTRPSRSPSMGSFYNNEEEEEAEGGPDSYGTTFVELIKR